MPGKNLGLIGTVTIANGASLSTPIDCGEYDRPVALWIPAWTAAALSFQAGPSFGGPWGEVGDKAGLAVVVSAAIDAAGAWVVLDPALADGLRFFRVRSGTKAAAQAQGAERVINVYAGEDV